MSARASTTLVTNAPSLLARVWTRCARMAELRRERRALARLSPDLLRDVGLSEGDAAREAARPFWDMSTLERRP